MAKETKKPVVKQQEEIKIKKVGKNLLVNISGKNYTKVINTEADIKAMESIKNKALLFNKKNSEATKTAILNLLDTKAKKVEKEKAEKKGIKKSVKKAEKEVKKVAKKAAKKAKDTPDNNLSIADQIKDALDKGDLSDAQIKELRSLLTITKEEEQKSVPQPQQAPKRSGEY